MKRLASELAAMGGADLTDALEELPVPAFVIDPSGIIRWQNAAALADAGDFVDRDFEDALPPQMSDAAARLRALVLEPGTPTEFTVDILDADGRVETREVSVAPIREGGSLLGMFGVATHVTVHPALPLEPAKLGLTPRQLEIVQLLAEGMSTAQIAETLHLSPTTVRNHIAHVLATLGVHTRVQAVVVASRAGLVRLRPPPEED